MRKAKIISTLGPVSSDVETIKELISAGVDIFRLNLSHGTHKIHQNRIDNIRKASKELEREVGILMDLQGPKIRVGKLENNLMLKKDEIWVLGPERVASTLPEEEKNFIPTVYEDLVKDVEVGHAILFNDGIIEAEVIEKGENFIKLKILVGGELSSHKGINLPDSIVSAKSFTEKDQEDLFFGIKAGIDFVALSFVKDEQDILSVKHLLHKMKINVPIIAKIERPDAIRNIKRIARVADAIMVARGDMGVELGNHKVPSIQKMIIDDCNKEGVPVITATQMLESMIKNSTPTRAEASDVANAIWDGTDAVMLSGETAVGEYPVKTVKLMAKIIEEAEKIPKDRGSLRNLDLSSTSTAVQIAASLIAENVKAKWIISFTKTGNSCRKMSRFRPKTRVLGVANNIEAVRRMNLFWGITPFLFYDADNDSHYLEKKIIEQVKKREKIVNGDKFVITYGDTRSFTYGSSNAIRVELVKDLPLDIRSRDFIDKEEFEEGRIEFNPTVCAGCQNCINVCPHDIWKETPEIPKLTYINRNKVPECDLDMKCVEVCPTNAINIFPKKQS